jgi:hypothetical protein
MTKSERFVLLVQTAAIVESLSREEWDECDPSPSSMAAIAVSAATKVPEADLPNDVTEACDALIGYVYDNTIPKPRWLIGIL